jgi:hypothetical protein
MEILAKTQKRLTLKKAIASAKSDLRMILESANPSKR